MCTVPLCNGIVQYNTQRSRLPLIGVIYTSLEIKKITIPPGTYSLGDFFTLPYLLSGHMFAPVEEEIQMMPSPLMSQSLSSAQVQ